MHIQSFLSPPRLPRVSPVVVLDIRSDNDADGNVRTCFAVMTTTGRVVEIIPEGSAFYGERAVHDRYPWFAHSVALRLGIECAYAIPIYVKPAEYRRWLTREPTETPDVARMQRLATRSAKWCAIRNALVEICRSSAEHDRRELVAAHEGRPNPYADSRGAIVYHRRPADGGDEISDHLRRALAAMTFAGMVERIDGNASTRDGAPNAGRYVATPTTPDLY